MENKEKYTRILSMALEIEGLAMLMQRRGDLINPEIHYILEDKIKQLADLAGVNLVNSNYEENGKTVLVEKQNTESINHHLNDGNCNRDESTILQEDLGEKMTDLESELNETQEKINEEIAAAVELEQSEDSDPAIEEDSDTESESIKNVNTLLRYFTLNDRFRFRKELFGGKDEDFKNALVVLQSINSPEGIKEYLEDDLCLDLNNTDVRDFYELVLSKIIG